MPHDSCRRPSHPVFAYRCPHCWGLHGTCFLRARSCGPSRTLSPLPPHLAAMSSGGGAAVRPCLPSSSTLVGAEVCGGGGGACRHPFVARIPQAQRKHGAGTRRGTRPLQGGGGHTLWLPLSPFLPCARTLPLPPYPAALSSGGGGRLSPPPYPHPPPSGGRGWVGGGGAHVVSFLLRACRRHDAGTTQARGEALGCCGEGWFPFGPSRPSPWYRLRTPGSPAAVAPWR